MAINRHLRMMLVLVAVSFAVTTLSISPALAVANSSKQTYKKAAKRHVSTGARRIKEVNGKYVAQDKPQKVASAPTTGCFGGWTQSWNGPVYVSWCPAPAYSGSVGQTSGWAAPAGASGSQSGSAPLTGGQASQPPPANIGSPPGSVCYNSCVPCWSGPVYTWGQPATAYSGVSGQRSSWAAPAQASGRYVPPLPPANVGNPRVSSCYYGGWQPCAPAPVATGNVCSATFCH